MASWRAVQGSIASTFCSPAAVLARISSRVARENTVDKSNVLFSLRWVSEESDRARRDMLALRRIAPTDTTLSRRFPRAFAYAMALMEFRPRAKNDMLRFKSADERSMMTSRAEASSLSSGVHSVSSSWAWPEERKYICFALSSRVEATDSSRRRSNFPCVVRGSVEIGIIAVGIMYGGSELSSFWYSSAICSFSCPVGLAIWNASVAALVGIQKVAMYCVAASFPSTSVVQSSICVSARRVALISPSSMRFPRTLT